MSISVKIYQSKMLNEVLAASSVGEIRNIINATVLTLKKQNISGRVVQIFLDGALKELKFINDRPLPYDYSSNIITAIVHLKELRFQTLGTVEEFIVKNVQT